MSAIKKKLKKFLRLYSWDSARGHDVIRVIEPLIKSNSTLLDAGCGEYGLASLMSSVNITGVDIIHSLWADDNFEFLQGSILSLPFESSSFSIAASVDVLEHLPSDIRTQAIGELVRVAKDAVVVAFPCGAAARETDENLSAELKIRSKPEPEWLEEHLQNPYPAFEFVKSVIESASTNQGRNVRVRKFYSERIGITKMLRWVAARSNKGFILANLLSGAVRPLVSRTGSDNSYRVIVLAEFV